MKFFFTLCSIVLLSMQIATAQLNMTLRSHLEYPGANGNDIWGWVDSEGIEYAIMGLTNGVSIVSLEDPDNATEVAFIPGQNSTWRDIKTWGDFAYVTTDQGGTTEGLLVIDLSGLPENISSFNWRPTIENLGTLNTCHNLYIDENGYCYLAGCNVNGGGMLIIDVFTTPGDPRFISTAPNTYSHDVYVRDDIMYSSEIFDGRLGIYDVSDKQNIPLIATQGTPFDFTHNAWLSDDGNVVFTTDERSNAPVAAYDISDLDNIEELDQFRPIATIGQNVIPHNVHVLNDYLVISHYSDGGVIVDASKPDNLVEVGNYDTWLSPETGFHGNWGAYPFYPSGLIALSDIESGLYIVEPTYVRACHLEGEVVDAVTGDPIFGADISINSTQPNATTTDLNGAFRTGQVEPGNFQASVIAEGYAPKTVDITLTNGQVTFIFVQLDQLIPSNINGVTIRDENGDPVPGATVQLNNAVSTFEAVSNENGNFFIPNVYQTEYQVIAGAWGYEYTVIDALTVTGDQQLVIELTKGPYRDDFIFDFGWTTTSDDMAVSGFWERGEPVGTVRSGGFESNTDFDIEGDLGDQCYVTGNAGGSVGNDDVDGGKVILKSPLMDLSDYENPIVTYNAWFVNYSGSIEPNDSMVVSVLNGIDSVAIEIFDNTVYEWRPKSEIALADYIDITDEMQISFTAFDQLFDNEGHVVEAAVDAFLVKDTTATDTTTTSIVEPTFEDIQLNVFPNPFADYISIDYDLEKLQFNRLVLKITNALGQEVRSLNMYNREARFNLSMNVPSGIYSVHLMADGEPIATRRLIKQ